MKGFIYTVFAGSLITFLSCRSDFSTVPSSGNLEFSKSKIFLDTVFNNIGSSTYGLKVYNRSGADIKIPVIQFGKGTTTKYRMMIDGMTGEDADNNGFGDGKVFKNIEILAKDSLFVFIEITNNVPAPTQLEFTYDDQILFDLGQNQQKVDLTTLIWDANFIFPNRPIAAGIKELLDINGNATDIIGHRLTDNDFSPVGSWRINNLKPTVVYGYALVPDGKTLTIDRGASLYFHADTESGLIIENGGRLIVNGFKNDYDATTGVLITKNEVTFEADRLEPFFEDVPGQWGGIFIISNAAVVASNKIDYLKLKNSIFGIYTQNINTPAAIPNLEIKNSQIYNSSAFGLLNRNTTISGKNLVINYSGQANMACLEGGNYNFTHCTFNNDWQSTSQRAVLLQDFYKDNTGAPQPSIPNANFKNCIIYGKSNAIELELKYNYSTPPNFDHCLIKFNDNNLTLPNKSIYNTIRQGNVSNINANLTELDPKFKNATKNQMNVLANSPAVGAANFSFSGFADILGNPRTSPSDIGAYNKP